MPPAAGPCEYGPHQKGRAAREENGRLEEQSTILEVSKVPRSSRGFRSRRDRDAVAMER